MNSAPAYGMPAVTLITAGRFADAQRAVLAVREQQVVILQAGHLDPETAQRAIDFVAGGVSALDGRAERLDATTFVFAPAAVELSHL